MAPRPGAGAAVASVDATGSASTLVLAALTGSGSGDDGGSAGGTYTATSLKPEGSWTSGGSTGSFDYNYPINVPTTSTDLAPQVALSYDSGSVDGETSTTQAQAGWSGDGWSTPQSFIEQSFVSCADKPEGTASPVSTNDECYDGPILTMSLNGTSTSLVWDKTAKIWKAQDDSGDVIKHVTNGGNNGTPTYNHDYWTVTERDGTVYSFGLNRLPGWTSGKPATNSVDSEPVYSAHASDGATQEPTDPCYSSSGFTHSVCTMAYRWNLDYVADTHGAAMAYYYQQDTNSYGEDNGTTTVSYVRDSHLDHIDYGFTDGNAYGTVPDKVAFVTGDRCVTGTCDPLNSSTKANWPDVPFDLICSSSCTNNTAPSFFSTVRLTSITTKQYSTATSSYVAVDSYALAQTIPAINGNATTPTLWLNSITHTGSDTTAGGSTSPITLPATTFTPVANPLPNRVDAVTDGLLAFYRNRIASITTESGAQIAVSYTVPLPCTAPVTLDPATNTTSCFPVSWTPDGFSAPILDWFYKYSVQQVTVHDTTGGAPDEITDYTYTGPAWHFDDNELVKAKYRTYGQFRGYRDVKTFTGDGDNDPRTESETIYYQGMSKDNDSTTITITDSQGGVHEDVDQLNGDALESTTYQGEGGPVDHSTITSYWVSAATVTRSRSGLPALTANWSAPAETFNRQATTSTGSIVWRDTETDDSYDASTTSATFGLLQHSYTHTVPAQSAYDSCATTNYALVNTSKNIVGLTSEAEIDSVACGGFTEASHPSVPASLNALTAPTSVIRPDQVVSDAQTFYDDPTFSTTFPQTTPPAKGDVTMTRKASGYAAGAFTYQTTAKNSYDSYGRPTSVTDGLGHTTTTTYTTNSIGLTTATSTTNAAGQTTSAMIDPERGLTLTTTDANSVGTIQQYDALGRATAVWLDSRPTTKPANQKYSYLVQNDGGITAVTSQKMNDEGGYVPTTTLYDSLLRTRQVQSLTYQGGRMITDTFYDSRGWTAQTNNGWWDSTTTPNTTLVSAQSLQDQVPNQDVYTYDGIGRAVVDTKEQNGVPVAGEATTTVYNGDRTTVFPPTGGTIQTTITDPLSRTTELDQYAPTAPTLHTPTNTFTGYYTITVASGSTRPVFYGYDGHGNQSTVTQGSSGPTWTSTYNLLGQAVTKDDPDAGTSTMQYDADGNLVQTTDSRGKTISYTYDVLNRKTGEYDSDLSHQQTGGSGNQLDAWVYDNSTNYNGSGGVSNAIGQLTAETAYWGGQAYTTQHTGFNVFGQSLGEIVTIPAATEGSQLGTSYTFTHIYSTETGLHAQDKYPAAGGLPAETVSYMYEGMMDLPASIGGIGGYAGNLDYDAYNRVTQETIGVGSNAAYLTNTYDAHTGRLNEQVLTRHTATPTTADDERYTYDPAGNITKQTDTRLNSTGSSETQCFTYDTLDELTAAWTATDNCAATPTTANHSMVGDNLGTASAYWTTWATSTGGSGFDSLGDRTEQTQHSLTSGSDTTTTYTYDGNGDDQPHTLTATSTIGGSTGSTSYSYDATGNMTHRNAAQGNQTLTWNDAGQLTTISGGTAGTTTFKYDADGNLLIEHDPNATILYLPGEQITLTGTVTTGTRYYTLPGGGTAIRTGTGTNYTFALTDQHGTPTLYLDHTAQIPTWRQYTPYGDTRGTSITPPDNHGFLNKPTDTSTGLTIIGARKYDPTTGRFISDDPNFESTSPEQLNGYSYASSNPVVHSDPTGMIDIPCADDSGSCGQNTYDGTKAGASKHDSHHKIRSAVWYSPDATTTGIERFWNPYLSESQRQIDSQYHVINSNEGFGLAIDWLDGLALMENYFYQIDPMTLAIRGTPHMHDVRAELAAHLEAGDYKSFQSDYDLPDGISGDVRVMQDISTWIGYSMTGVGKSKANAAAIGSYRLQVSVMSVDAQAGRAVVVFNASNTMDTKSFFRNPSTKKVSGPSGGFAPNAGPMSPVNEVFQWVEVVPFSVGSPGPVPAPSPVPFGGS